jgi:hypothetical protein
MSAFKTTDFSNMSHQSTHMISCLVTSGEKYWPHSVEGKLRQGRAQRSSLSCPLGSYFLILNLSPILLLEMTLARLPPAPIFSRVRSSNTEAGFLSKSKTYVLTRFRGLPPSFHICWQFCVGWHALPTEYLRESQGRRSLSLGYCSQY